MGKPKLTAAFALLAILIGASVLSADDASDAWAALVKGGAPAPFLAPGLSRARSRAGLVDDTTVRDSRRALRESTALAVTALGFVVAFFHRSIGEDESVLLLLALTATAFLAAGLLLQRLVFDEDDL